MTPAYSIIVPVFNRPQEVEELLLSLHQQTFKDFEIVLVEDGSTRDCAEVVKAYNDKLNINYFFKQNSGPGDSRNFGMTKARSDFFIFFDSDCIIPEDYLEQLDTALKHRPLDAFGGPDRAHPSFSKTQKAINYAMTSMLTTGGIRGRKKQMDTFQPRSFNMGIRRAVFQKVGGFANLHPGEDPDWSYRILDAGFKTGLVPQAYVFHKRRIDLNKFRVQVYKFGLARTILMRLHPRSRKFVYALPSIILVMGLSLLVAGFFQPVCWWLLLAGILIVFLDALFRTGNLETALLGLLSVAVQVSAYGWGYLKGVWYLFVLKKDPPKAFPEMYFLR